MLHVELKRSRLSVAKKVIIRLNVTLFLYAWVHPVVTFICLDLYQSPVLLGDHSPISSI